MECLQPQLLYQQIFRTHLVTGVVKYAVCSGAAALLMLTSLNIPYKILEQNTKAGFPKEFS